MIPAAVALQIDATWTDARGDTRDVDPAVLAQLREAFGEPLDDPADAPLFARRGDDVGPGLVTFEDGAGFDLAGPLPPDTPLGYHRVVLDGDDVDRLLVVTPGMCHVPERRSWGWAVQLYAARSRASWGIGDLGDLRRLGAWAAGQRAGFLLVNPLAAVAPGSPQQPSPYSPTSRRFANPIYLDVERVARSVGYQGADLAPLAAAGRALSDLPRIDRDRVLELKMTALEAIWRANESGRPVAIDAERHRFAIWSAIAELHGPDFRRWPPELRRPGSAEVAAAAAHLADRVRFHEWLQVQLTIQLDVAARAIGVVQDLPIGFDPGGADAWVWQDLLATGVSVGAPPDVLNPRGQDWGLPPFVPWRLAQADYRPFIQTVRASMQRGGGLRIDHVMGLFRLWSIPPGADPADGAYVRYPFRDLLDIVALESERNEALVIGEDLGTVEPGAREALGERRVLSYRLLWFEQAEPQEWPQQALAAVTTHDLPTVAGLWTGHDGEELRAAGLDPQDDDYAAIRDRVAERAGLDDDSTPERAVIAAHEVLAESPSVLLCASLDDAVAATARPNIPNAGDARPNWSLPLPVLIDDLPGNEIASTIAATFRAAVDTSLQT